jgi:hypothetical protein
MYPFQFTSLRFIALPLRIDSAAKLHKSIIPLSQEKCQMFYPGPRQIDGVLGRGALLAYEQKKFIDKPEAFQ